MRESIKLDNDKYEVVLIDNGREFKALRYGEEWRDLIGDNLVLSMFFEIQKLKDDLKEIGEMLENKEIYELIQKIKKSDNGKRYSLEEVLEILRYK